MTALKDFSKPDVKPSSSRLSISDQNEDTVDIRDAFLPKERPPFDGYDPRDHRKPSNPIKLWMAYFNLLRTIVGGGLLGYPLAVSQAGLILGPIIAIGTGALITFSHCMLLDSLNEVARRLKVPYVSYRDGFRLALLHGPIACKCIGTHGPTLVALCMTVSQVCTCTVIFIFTADCLKDVLDWTTIKPALLIIMIPVMVMQMWMKTLTIITYISAIGNVVNLVALIIVTYLCLVDVHGDYIYYNFEMLPFFFSFGTCLFNCSAVGVVLSIDNSLENPRELMKPCGILTIGVMIPSIVGAIFGVLGYVAFGTMEENVLRYLPFDDNLALLAIGLYMFSMVFVYPIQCFPGLAMITEVILSCNRRKPLGKLTMNFTGFIMRPIFVFVTFIIAYAIPFQGPFVALVGNLCTTMLALVFPALMDLCLHYPYLLGRYRWVLARDSAIIFLGVVCWTYGVYLCGRIIHMRILALMGQFSEEYF